MQAADFIAYELKKNVESRRDWFDSTIGDDPDTWEETERRWLASKGLPYPYIRKSLQGLLEAINLRTCAFRPKGHALAVCDSPMTDS